MKIKMFDNIYNIDLNTRKAKIKFYMHYWVCEAFDEYDGCKFVLIVWSEMQNIKKTGAWLLEKTKALKNYSVCKDIRYV